MREVIGVFVWRGDGRYRLEDAVKTYRNRHAAQKFADKMTYGPDGCSNPGYVVRTILVDLFCTCCDRPLVPDKAVWLVLNGTTNTFHQKDEDIPDGDINQGGFPFGSTCAKKALKKGRTTV